MSLNWNGTNFDPDIQTSFVDDNLNNIYLYEFGYGLYPVAIDDNGDPYYDGSLDYAVKFIPSGTPFTLDTNYTSDQLNNVISDILNNQLAIFSSNSTTVVNTNTQTPSTLVTNTILASATLGTSQAIQANAPLLQDLPFNFALNKLSTSYNGASILSQISNALGLQQNTLFNTQKAINAISDFKKKIIRKQTLIANDLSKVNTSVSNLNNMGALSSYQSTFGSNFTNLNSALSNIAGQSAKQLSNLLPKNLGGGNIQNTIQNAITSEFGSVVPNIVNPIDKFVADLQDLTNPAASFLNNIVNQGFSSIENQLNFINQTLNIVNNIQSKMPVTNTIPIPSAGTNISIINSTLTKYYSSLFSSTTSSATTPVSSSQMAINNLNALMQITGPINTQTAPVTAANYDPNDPSQGGTLFGTSVLSSIFGAQEDPSVTAPNITASADSYIASNQYDQQLEQTFANQAGTINTPEHGSGFNVLEELNLRPRNNPVNQTPGSYNINTGTFI